jgi:hypothetical protein
MRVIDGQTRISMQPSKKAARNQPLSEVVIAPFCSAPERIAEASQTNLPRHGRPLKTFS